MICLTGPRRTSHLAIAAVIVALQLSEIADAAPPHRARTATAERQVSVEQAQAAWGEAMLRVRPPAKGCAKARFPELAWHPVACSIPPNDPMMPRQGAGTPFVVGNGNNDMVPHTSPRTTSADGNFPSVSAGIVENGLVGKPGMDVSQTDAYTLQLNTNTFSPSSGCTAGSGAGCQGWEQFVYTNDNSTHQAYIQYWLIAFNTTCPGGWNSFPYPGPSDISCYRNSASAALAADQPVGNLGVMSLHGEASATGDRITVRSGADMGTTAGLNAVGLAGGWTDSEFNVFGDAWGHDATFGANTSMDVQLLVHNGTTTAPTCALSSFTGETNNLTLSGMSAAGPLASPGVRFTQTNMPATAASCVGASGLGDTHLRTFTGLFYDFQATGDFTLAQTGGFEAQARQISGAPTWPDAAVNQAVAARLGKFDVAVCSAKEPVVMIGNESHALGDGQTLDLGDGSGVRRVGNIVLMVDPQGNSLRAELLGSHIDATVGLGKWPVRVRGLLASSGRANTVLTPRDGTTYTSPYNFTAFYGKYGESWRVPNGRSLLDVCGRASENSQPRRPLTVRNLNPELARKARAVCLEAGVKDKALLEACTIDVAVLGDEKAARAFTTLHAPTALGRIN